MIPGSDVLGLAMQYLDSTHVDYFQFLSYSTNSAGYDVTTYKAKVTYETGSVQPVKRSNYQRMGLDYSKKYITWFVSDVDAVDLERDLSGDVIETLGGRWQLDGTTDWYRVDGWKAMLGVWIGPATGAVTNA